MRVGIDITKDNKRKLDELFKAFSITAEGMYIYICDMEHDVSRWSKSAVDFFGLPDEYMKNAGGIWADHVHPDDVDKYNESIDSIFTGNNNGHNMQYRARTREGEYVVCTCKGIVIRDSMGKPKYFMGAIKNHGIHSYTDNNTGVRSLYAFFEDLRTIFWNKEEAVIMQIGLTDFSRYNDVFGYSFGNRILQSIARMLGDMFRHTGEIYRLDGTKFAVISKVLKKDEMADIYKSIQKKSATDFMVDNERIAPSFNAGLIVVDQFDISDKTVYSCLKYAYFESKKHKLGDLVIYEDSITDIGRNKLEMIHSVRRDITKSPNGFYLCYQPVVHPVTEKLKGVEALIRWKNDKYGTVPPNSFIPEIEKDNLFPQLGNWILEQAMTDGLKLLEKYPGIMINVNLSYAQLEKSGFVNDVLDIIRKTKFPAENLCLELTERCRLIDGELLKNIMAILRDEGVKFALDDFGTGFSSLSILRELHLDIVKIDREFVKGIVNFARDREMIRNVAELVSCFDADLCVEGVEDIEMRDILRNVNPGSLQGYLYSKPVTIDEFMKLKF